MKTCASCPNPAKCKKAGKCLMAKMAKGGAPKLKAPSIMVAIAVPKAPKVKVPKAKK